VPLLQRPDARIHYEVTGEGEPVLFVMGLGADGEGWRPQVEVVAPRRRAIVIDNRGVGRSSRSHRLDYSIAAAAADAAAVLDHLGERPAHVVGISLGGAIAEVLAIERPDLVRSLVLAATFARPDPALLRRSIVVSAQIARWLLHPGAAEEGRIMRAVLRGWMPVVFSKDYVRDNYDALRAMIEGAVARGVRAEVALLQLAAVWRHDMLDRLAAVRAPALILAGDRDDVVPVTRAEELARALPHARLEVLAGGHGLNFEARAAFNEALLRFFDEVEGRGEALVA
jgi:3-oxoadipate enol-lactonase